MSIMQLIGSDCELRVRVEENEVCVAASFKGSRVAADAGKRCRCAAHPADDVVEPKAVAIALCMNDRKSKRDAGDASPRQVEAA